VAGLDSLLTRLLEQGVEFVVVGGYAAIAHGCTVLTQDIEVCLSLDEANLRRLLAATRDLHPVHRMAPARPPFDESALSTRWKNLYLDTDWGQLAGLGAISGVGGFEEVLASSETVGFGRRDCRILTLDALIRAKEAMGRPKDRETTIQLKAIRDRLGGEA